MLSERGQVKHKGLLKSRTYSKYTRRMPSNAERKHKQEKEERRHHILKRG